MKNPYPSIIINDDNLRIWFKRDDIFFVPKLNIFFEIRSFVFLFSKDF